MLNSNIYDSSSVTSIYEFSLQLKGKCLADLTLIPDEVLNVRNRGDLGTLLEKFFFRHTPPNTHEPDFPAAELELKTTGLVRISNNRFRAKERLVLTTINFQEIVNEDWDSSVFLKKCKNLLIVFYEYRIDLPVTKMIFPIYPLLYSISGRDYEVIKRDWEFIADKVRRGLAHELSEGDTFYLSACRKGSGGPTERSQTQPNSQESAKSRAFAFKQSYLNQILTHHQVRESNLEIHSEVTIEKATKELFSPFLGKSIDDIANHFGFFKKGKNHKSYHRELSMKILAKSGETNSELRKAGIILKVIRIHATERAREPMSFPAFKPEDLALQSWEDSNFFEITESKFLFVVYKTNEDGSEKLEKIGYWNMPYQDRLEAKKVWDKTKRAIEEGRTDFPRMKESQVAHVRPHARNAADQDKSIKGESFTKQCFWLNQSYISKVLLDI